MGPEQFRSQKKIICVLCEKSDETKITGPLSSKESISAHENCLLFASGIYCKNSPTYDDLFGFAVEDVKEEQRRGKRLLCHHCKKNGATAGCDLKRCKRSYHFPCAIEARATIDEDINKGRFKLFCELHDPKSKKPRLADSQRPDLKRLDRRDSNSSTGSSEVSVSKKKKRNSPILIDSDDDIEDTLDPIYAPVKSEGSTSPNQYNWSNPDPESKRPCARPSPSTAGSLKGGLTSDQKACGSADSSRELHSRSVYDSLVRSAEVETPRRKKSKRIVDSDDESPTSTDRVEAPAVSDTEESMLPKQPSQPTPVPEKTRLCKKLNPSTTEADDDDTDIDSDDSQSLLQPEMYHITVPCRVIMDSGPSAKSEYSLEPSSPAGAAPAAMCTLPVSVAALEQEETPSTSRTSPPPRAQTTDPVSPGTTDPTPNQDHASDGPIGQSGSPSHSSPTADVPAMSISTVQTLSLLVQASDLKSEQLPEPSPLAGVSSSPGRPAAADASDVGTTGKSQSSAAIFWTRCNEAGWTKEVFSELMSQLSSLGERVQSQEASHQDYDVALKVLVASGLLPCIFTQLEQDLKKQERDLQRKKAALRDAKAVLDV